MKYNSSASEKKQKSFEMEQLKIDINMVEFVKLIQKKCPSPKCIVEVGSMDGKDSLFFKESFPNCVVYAIEALPENYENMKKHRSINCIQAVIFDEDIDEIEFNIKDTNGLHGVHDRGSRYGTRKISLSCYRFDTIARKYSIPDVDVLKIDVEGATLNVLRGMGDRLNEVKIMHVETESYPFFENQELHDEVSAFLISKKFELIDISEVKIDKNGYQYDSVWTKCRLAY